jgi:hypothetical protein
MILCLLGEMQLDSDCLVERDELPLLDPNILPQPLTLLRRLRLCQLHAKVIHTLTNSNFHMHRLFQCMASLKMYRSKAFF